MEPRIPRDKAAALHVLGELKQSPYVKPYIHQGLDGGFIDFTRLLAADGFVNLSTGEQHIVRVARSLYNRGPVDLGKVAADVDDPSWRRVIQAMLILRGLDEAMHVQPGNWIDGEPD